MRSKLFCPAAKLFIHDPKISKKSQARQTHCDEIMKDSQFKVGDLVEVTKGFGFNLAKLGIVMEVKTVGYNERPAKALYEYRVHLQSGKRYWITEDELAKAISKSEKSKI